MNTSPASNEPSPAAQPPANSQASPSPAPQASPLPTAKHSPAPSPSRSRRAKPRQNLSPRGRARQSIQKAVQHRGKNAYNLTYYFSPKKGEDVVARGDLAWFAGLWLESRPEIVDYDMDLPTYQVEIMGEMRETIFDVRARHKVGRIEHWELKPQAEIDNPDSRYQTRQRPAQEAWAAANNGTVLTYSETHFLKMRTRLSNWASIIAALTRTRNIDLTLPKAEMAARFANGQALSLKDAAHAADPGERALQLSALFTLLSQGRVTANLDATLLGPTTQFMLAVTPASVNSQEAV